jgi:hypothetical protein
MKAKMQYVQPPENLLPGNERVRLEIQSFLKALDSYPDRFAREPEVSFEQHFCSLVAAGKSELRRRN